MEDPLYDALYAIPANREYLKKFLKKLKTSAPTCIPKQEEQTSEPDLSNCSNQRQNDTIEKEILTEDEVNIKEKPSELALTEQMDIIPNQYPRTSSNYQEPIDHELLEIPFIKQEPMQEMSASNSVLKQEEPAGDKPDQSICSNQRKEDTIKKEILTEDEVNTKQVPSQMALSEQIDIIPNQHPRTRSNSLRIDDQSLCGTNCQEPIHHEFSEIPCIKQEPLQETSASNYAFEQEEPVGGKPDPSISSNQRKGGNIEKELLTEYEVKGEHEKSPVPLTEQIDTISDQTPRFKSISLNIVDQQMQEKSTSNCVFNQEGASGEPGLSIYSNLRKQDTIKREVLTEEEVDMKQAPSQMALTERIDIIPNQFPGTSSNSLNIVDQSIQGSTLNCILNQEGPSGETGLSIYSNQRKQDTIENEILTEEEVDIKEEPLQIALTERTKIIPNHYSRTSSNSLNIFDLPIQVKCTFNCDSNQEEPAGDKRDQSICLNQTKEDTIKKEILTEDEANTKQAPSQMAQTEQINIIPNHPRTRSNSLNIVDQSLCGTNCQEPIHHEFSEISCIKQDPLLETSASNYAFEQEEPAGGKPDLSISSNRRKGGNIEKELLTEYEVKGDHEKSQTALSEQIDTISDQNPRSSGISLNMIDLTSDSNCVLNQMENADILYRQVRSAINMSLNMLNQAKKEKRTSNCVLNQEGRSGEPGLSIYSNQRKEDTIKKETSTEDEVNIKQVPSQMTETERIDIIPNQHPRTSSIPLNIVDQGMQEKRTSNCVLNQEGPSTEPGLSNYSNQIQQDTIETEILTEEKVDIKQAPLQIALTERTNIIPNQYPRTGSVSLNIIDLTSDSNCVLGQEEPTGEHDQPNCSLQRKNDKKVRETFVSYMCCLCQYNSREEDSILLHLLQRHLDIASYEIKSGEIYKKLKNAILNYLILKDKSMLEHLDNMGLLAKLIERKILKEMDRETLFMEVGLDRENTRLGQNIDNFKEVEIQHANGPKKIMVTPMPHLLRDNGQKKLVTTPSFHLFRRDTDPGTTEPRGSYIDNLKEFEGLCDIGQKNMVTTPTSHLFSRDSDPGTTEPRGSYVENSKEVEVRYENGQKIIVMTPMPQLFRRNLAPKKVKFTEVSVMGDDGKEKIVITPHLLKSHNSDPGTR